MIRSRPRGRPRIFGPLLCEEYMKRILTAIIITMMALSAASCSSKVQLEGEWKITSAGNEKIVDTEASPSLTFNTETGRIHGYTGVNIVNGEYEQEGRRLTLKGLGVTMMAGPEEDMNLERNILDAFNDTMTAKMAEDGSLEFLNGDGDVIMTLSKR